MTTKATPTARTLQTSHRPLLKVSEHMLTRRQRKTHIMQNSTPLPATTLRLAAPPDLRALCIPSHIQVQLHNEIRANNQGHEHTLGQAEKTHCVTPQAGLTQPGAPRATRADQHRAKGKRPRRPRQELHGSPNKDIIVLSSFPKPSPVNLYKGRHNSVVILPPSPMAPVLSLNGLTNRSGTMAPTLAHANTRATSTAHQERDTQHEMPHSIGKTPLITCDVQCSCWHGPPVVCQLTALTHGSTCLNRHD